MKTNHWIESSQRFYRRLLRLYPRTHRAEYETEMFNVFTDQCRDAHNRQGWRGIALLWPRILADTCVAAVREHITDPQAKVGLLEAAPNKPLPWKGVLLVLIPGLIFFVSQIAQVTTDKDWFFLAYHRAAYFLILPVLLAWSLTGRFPIWGLIPLGLLYAILGNYNPTYLIGKIPFLRYLLTLIPSDIQFDPVYLIAVLTCTILICGLIWYNARRQLISRAAWGWLLLYGLLILLQIGGNFYTFIMSSGMEWKTILNSPDMKVYLLQMPLWYLYNSLSFLLLIFIGKLFASKHGGLSFLVLLGYLLPTVIFGRYGEWNEIISFYAVGLAVVTYRFVVALVAPIWLVRAASQSGRQRAAAIPVAVAIASQITLNVAVYLAWMKYSDFQVIPLDFLLTIANQLIIAAGLGLAVALYLPTGRDSAPTEVQPQMLSVVED
ncbi:hypothetical protein ANAEL_05019 [Anaerolineales bacterium]|nr:hypothetical protein ANAEL_05019 [Anaerolineales bacterium]